METRMQYPVRWFDGMKLEPQHFQQTDAYWRHHVVSAVSMVEPYFYGVSKYKFELDGGRELRLEFGAMLPDGTLVDDVITAKVDEIIDEGARLDKPLTIFAVVTDERYDESHERFRVVTTMERDVHQLRPKGDAADVDVQIARRDVELDRMAPSVKLTARESPPSGNAVAISVARIEPRRDGTYRMVDYLPPMLRTDALDDKRLSTFLGRIAEAVREKARFLRDVLHAPPDDVRALAAELPAFEIVASSVCHPWIAYTALARLVGTISGMTPLLMTDRPPAYDHDDPWPGFKCLGERVCAALDAVESPSWRQPFTKTPEGWFVVDIEQPIEEKRFFVEAEFEEETKPADAEAYLMSARIGSASQMNDLLRRRTDGLEREPVSLEDHDLAPTEGAFGFLIHNSDTDDDGSDVSLEPGGQLAIHATDADAEPTALYLIVRNVRDGDA